MLDANAKNKLTTDEATAPTGHGELAKEVVLSLSKEIETASNNMMVFRTKIAFALLIGPFLLLGPFLVNARGSSISFKWDRLGLLATVFYCISFIGIAFVCAGIEKHIWDQCNRWRQLIAELHNNPQLPIKADDIKFVHNLDKGYYTGYGLLLIAVLCIVIMMTKVRVAPALEAPGATRPPQTGSP